MALTDNGNMVTTMPVAPAYSNGGIGGFGGDGWWILLLLLFAGGGWGNGFGGGFGYDGLYPWLNNSQNINDGFRDSMLNDSITSIKDGVNGISTQLCSGFAGVNSAIANGFAQSEIADNSRQMANMNQMFSLSQQLANCCCENRLATANLGSDIAREACADRQAVNDGVRDIIANQTAGIQSILTQMANDKLDEKNETISQLRQELLYARGQASQVAQNSTIINGVYDRLSACPVGTVPVYGEQPIFTCNNNSCGCGCGM